MDRHRRESLRKQEETKNAVAMAVRRIGAGAATARSRCSFDFCRSGGGGLFCVRKDNG